MITFFKNGQDARKYASYFIWFLIRDFVGEDIKKFNPGYIVVSYSGRIQIIDEHFVRIMQELCLASSRKVLFYPNFTSELAEDVAINYTFDNFPPSQSNLSEVSIDFYRKISQFLKISSGTYNLEFPYEREPIISRYKLGKINNYILGLLNALSAHEYKQFENRVCDIIMRAPDIILSRNISEHSKDIQATIPNYYKEMFAFINNMLLHANTSQLASSPELGNLLKMIREKLREIAES